MNQSRKPLVHLLFIGIKTPEWCNDSESGISKLLDLMKAEGSAIIALGDKEMTTEDNNAAFLALKQKVDQLQSEGHKADRWVVVSNNKNFRFIGDMHGRPIDFIYAHLRPGENTYLYEDDERSQYDKPRALNNVLIAMRQQYKQAEKNKLSDLPPTLLIKKLLVKMVYHLNAMPPDRNNERELREIIDFTEHQLTFGKLFPKPNPVNNQQPKGTTMDKKHIVQLLKLTCQMLKPEEANSSTIDGEVVCRDLTWVKENAETTLRDIVPAVTPIVISEVLLALQTSVPPHPLYAAKLTDDLKRVIDEMKEPEAEEGSQPADDQKAPVVHVAPMGKRKQVVETLARAIGAIENGADLNETEKKDLVDDLAFIHRNFDTIIPEPKAPAHHKNVNLILDGLSDQSWGKDIQALFDEMRKRGGRTFLFNQHDADMNQDVASAAGLGDYLKVVHPDSTWVVIKVNPDEQKEATLGDKPSTVMMQHFKSKVLDHNVAYLTFTAGIKFTTIKSALYQVLEKHLRRIAGANQAEEKASESSTPMTDELLKALRNLDVTREALMTLLPKPSSEPSELQEYLRGWMSGFAGPQPGPGMNYQEFGRLPQGGVRFSDDWRFNHSGHPDHQGYNPVGGSSTQQETWYDKYPPVRPSLFMDYARRPQGGSFTEEVLRSFDGVVAVHLHGNSSEKALKRFAKIFKEAFPRAILTVVQHQDRQEISLLDFIQEEEAKARLATGRKSIFHAIFFLAQSDDAAHRYLCDFQHAMVTHHIPCPTVDAHVVNAHVLLNASDFGSQLLQFIQNPQRNTGVNSDVSYLSPQGRNNVEAMKRTLERNGLGRYGSQPRLFDAFNQFEGVLAIHAVGKHNARYLRAAYYAIQSLIPKAQVEVFAYSLDDNDGTDTCGKLMENVSKLKQHQLHVVVSAAQPMPPLPAPGVSSNLGYMLYSALSTTFRPSKGAVTMLAEGAITDITVQALQEVFVSVLFSLLESEALPQPTRRF
jgi:hypothetical protein